MSARITPSDPARSELVDMAIDIFGYHARSGLIHFIGEHPGSQFGDIKIAMPELLNDTLIRHLRVLEKYGVLTLDLPPEQRRGRSPRYTVDRDRVAALLGAWIAYVGLDVEVPRAPSA